jgi:hypothetical protein
VGYARKNELTFPYFLRRYVESLFHLLEISRDNPLISSK